MKTFNPLMGSKLVEDLVEKGMLPPGTTRFIIDSGNPGGVVRIFWSGFADVDMIRELIDKLEPLDET